MADSTNVFPPGFRAEDDGGVIVGGGTVQFFAAGTTDPLEVFSDRALSISLGPTVGLNAGGYPVSSGGSRVIVYTGTDPYRIRLMDDDGVVVWEHDDVRGALDTAGFDALIAASFQPGTVLSFYQTNAPTGWTKIVAHNNASPRIVSGMASSGGSQDFTTVFTSRTLTQANLPSYTLPNTLGHNISLSGDPTTIRRSGGNTVGGPGSGGGLSDILRATDTTNLGIAGGITGSVTSGGSGAALDFAVKYVDCILASKD